MRMMDDVLYLQDKILVPSGIESLGLVAGVVSGVGVGRQIKCAEGIAQTRNILAAEASSPVNLQVTL